MPSEDSKTAKAPCKQVTSHNPTPVELQMDKVYWCRPKTCFHRTRPVHNKGELRCF